MTRSSGVSVVICWHRVCSAEGRRSAPPEAPPAIAINYGSVSPEALPSTGGVHLTEVVHSSPAIQNE
jgi:hypothetical protein